MRRPFLPADSLLCRPRGRAWCGAACTDAAETARRPNTSPSAPSDPSTPPTPPTPRSNRSSAPRSTSFASTSRSTAATATPLADLQPSDFVVKEDGVLQNVETVQFVKLNGQPPADLKESIDIRSPEHADVEAAREDVRLFVLFLDDYHVDKSPQIMIPLRRTLKAFVEKLGPYDLVAVVDPLTPLTHIRVHPQPAGAAGDGAEVRGPPRRALPGEERRRRDAADAAQHVGAARRRDARRDERDRRRISAACAKAASRCSSSARARRSACAAATIRGWKKSCSPPTAAT